jgi:hypothetical protein
MRLRVNMDAAAVRAGRDMGDIKSLVRPPPATIHAARGLHTGTRRHLRRPSFLC